MKYAIDPVYRAIADPTRRKIIDLLAHSQQSVSNSPPTSSLHSLPFRSTFVNSASRLVEYKRVGVERRYSLTAQPLAEIYHWVSRYRMLFDPSGHAWEFASAVPKAKRGAKAHGN
jgi:DNA-binding transcriptional ArsR family regulator